MQRSLEKIDYETDTEETARFARALSHPTRIYILKQLCCRSSCFTGDLVELLPISQSTISQHLKELKNAGLIQGQLEPPKVKYCINKEKWKRAKMLFNDLLC